jgi:tRNA (guanine9-N1)-methyltransferase
MLAPWDDDGAGGLRLVIDCGMDDLMTDGERRSLTVQIQLGYAAALRAALGGDKNGEARRRRDGDPDDVEPAAPARILLSSVAGRFEAALDRDSGSASWPLRRSRKPFDEAAFDAVAPGRGGEADEADRAVDATNDRGGPSPLRPRPRLVFLSPDAPTALTSAPDRSAVYVIGGLCDYKRLKRATLDRAERAGIDAARLPILESLGANAPVNVLTVDQCVEALAIADRTRGDWARALRTVLPARKLREMDRRLEERRERREG